jgi:hypothetical protein
VGEWLALREALGPHPGRPRGRRGAMTEAAHRTPVVRLAPAKLNLTLAVVGRPGRRVPRPPLGLRPTGTHDVLTVAPWARAGTTRST